MQRSYDSGKDLKDPEEDAVVTMESYAMREEPVVTRKVSLLHFLQECILNSGVQELWSYYRKLSGNKQA